MVDILLINNNIIVNEYDIENNLECVICLECYSKQYIAYCENCKESGQVCHNCQNIQHNLEQNIKQCIICKKETMLNIVTIEETTRDSRENLIVVQNNHNQGDNTVCCKTCQMCCYVITIYFFAMIIYNSIHLSL